MVANAKVSVLMGIYNCEKTLYDAINSIINQTYFNWELILCDDGSKDTTFFIAKEFQMLYPEKIILLSNEKNIKLAATLNRCLKYAKGDYIARMDSDDISLENRLEVQCNFLDNNLMYDLVGSSVLPFDENDKTRGIRIYKEKPQKQDLKYGTPFAHPTIMMRKEAIKELKGYSESSDCFRCEDLELWIRFYKSGRKGYNLKVPLLKYREGRIDYRRRNLQDALRISKLTRLGINQLGMNKVNFIFSLKPIIRALLPSSIVRIIHNMKLKSIDEVKI